MVKYAGATVERNQDSDGTTPDIQTILTDNLGSSSVVVTDANGPVKSNRYSVWGETRDTTALPTDLGYTGQEKVSNMPFLYYNARWYDPTLGRFLQPDSIIPEPYNPITFDRYAYVNNNPIMNNDPTGHCIGPLLPLCLAVATTIIAAGPSLVSSLPMLNYWGSYTPKDEVDAAFTQLIPGLMGAGAGLIEGIRAIPVGVNSAQKIDFVGKPQGVNAPVSQEGRAFVQDVADNSRVLSPTQAQKLAAVKSENEFKSLLGDGWSSAPTFDKKGTSFKLGPEEVRLMDKGGSTQVFRWSTTVPEDEALASGLKIHQVGANTDEMSGWIQNIPPKGSSNYALNWTIDGNLSWVRADAGHIVTGIPLKPK